MFARINICFVVGRDRTPNAAAHWSERENGPLQGQSDAGVPCGDRGRSLADRELYRKRQISLVCHHLCEDKPGVGRQPEPAFRRLAAPQCRAHRANQESTGSQAKGEITPDRHPNRFFKTSRQKIFSDREGAFVAIKLLSAIRDRHKT
jgi:hypothetical protein